MRRSATILVVIPVLFLLTLSACSGGSSSISTGTVSTLVVNPPTISMNKGDVQQLSVTPEDSTGATVVADVTYASSNPSFITVSTGGNLCAGTWDANFIICKPDATAGVSDITITSQKISTTIHAFVHEKVDTVQVNPVAGGCVSMGDTTQLTASAFSKDPTVCNALPGSPAPPCQIPTAQLGSFLWTATSNVVSIDNTAASNGLATAQVPGQTQFFASISRNHSASVPFTTCGITSIDIAVQGATAAPFSFNKAETKTLTATVKDSSGKAIDGTKLNATSVITNNPPILWTSTPAFTATNAGAAVQTTATATAVNPGPALLFASCTPPSCNQGLPPAFSNPIIGTVNGSSVATIYAASTSSLTLIPIESSTNTAGTAITLPRTPNSMVANNSGSKLLLGADAGGVMIVDTVTAAVTTAGVIGKVIGMSPDGAHGFVFDPTKGTVSLLNVITGGVENAVIVTGTATSADTTPDGKITVIVAGNQLFTFNATQGQQKFALPGGASNVAVLASGTVVYVPINTGTIHTLATCNPAISLDTPPATAPTLVTAIPSGDGAVAVDSPNLVVMNSVNIVNTPLIATCPMFNFTQSTTAVPLQGGTFTARQLLITPDSTNVFVTNDTGKVLNYNLKTAAVTPITLAAGATASFTGGSLLDSTQVYVGGGDGTVHRITTSSLTDTQQISVGLKKADGTAAVPDLVVVRNHS